MNVFQIKVSQRTGNLARHHLLQLGTGVVIASLTDQIQLVARMLNTGWDDVLGILDQPYHADHWRWVNGRAVVFIVKRNITGNDWRIKDAASFSHPFD